MSFVEQEDVLSIFEGMTQYLFKELLDLDIPVPFPRMSWHDAMKRYGSDKPDTRFGMEFVEVKNVLQGHGFSVFDNAAYIGAIVAPGAASYTRKQLDALTDFVKRPQVGASGMVYARVEADGTVKSSAARQEEVLLPLGGRLPALRVGRGDTTLLRNASSLHFAQARGYSPTG